MASPDASNIIPEIPLRQTEDAERQLFENFKILQETMKDGYTGTLTLTGHTITVVRGIITNIT